MEEWALYNAVWVVNSLSSTPEQWNLWNNTIDLNEDLTNGRPGLTVMCGWSAKRFLCNLT